MHRIIQFCIVAALIALCCSVTYAERDVDYVRLLREQGFWDIALDEIARLESIRTTDEDTRAQLLIEKARVYRDIATYSLKPDKQADNIEKSRAALDLFLGKYPNRPEKLEVQFEKLLLSKMLGKAYATAAACEAEDHERRILFGKAIRSFQSAHTGYLELSRSFVAKAAKLESQITELQNRKASAHPDEMAALLNKIEILKRDKSRSDEYGMQCEFLAAGCLLEQGLALTGPDDKPESEAREIIEKAIRAYEAFYAKYRDTIYLPTAYKGLFGIIECLRMTDRKEEALNRIIGETTAFLIKHRDNIEDPTLKATLDKIRIQKAKMLNDLNRPDEAAKAVQEAMLSPLRNDEAYLERYRAFLVKGNTTQGILGLLRLIKEPGPARLGAKKMLANWLRDNYDSPATTRIPLGLRYEAAVSAYYEHRYSVAEKMFLAIAKDAKTTDKKAYKPRSLLMAANCRVNAGQMASDTLAAKGKKKEADAAMQTALGKSVELLFGRLVPEYGQSDDEEVVRIVQQALALSVKWQGRIVSIDGSEKNIAAMKEILLDFNRRFPDMRGIPDSNYIEALTLEMKKEYSRAIEKYAQTNPGKNQWFLAGIRKGVCEYKILRASDKANEESLVQTWNDLTHACETAEKKLAEVGEDELEKYERPDFIYAIAEATYYRATLVYGTDPKKLSGILPQGKDKHRFVVEILQDFATKYPGSDFKSVAAFLQAASLIKIGDADEANELLPLLKDNPDRYAAVLRELRDLYHLKYIEATRRNDETAARNAGAKYIVKAREYYEKFSDRSGTIETTQMANYYYDTGRFDEALPMLRLSAKALEKRIEELKAAGDERQTREAIAAQLIIKDRLATCLFESDISKAAKIYDELVALRQRLLKSEHPGSADYRSAVQKDYRLIRYALRRAMCDIVIESEKTGGKTDLDKLAAAVNALAEKAQVIESKTRLWWNCQYWLAYGLYLQGNVETAKKMAVNLKNRTSDFSDEFGGGLVGYKGKTFKVMFGELIEMTGGQ